MRPRRGRGVAERLRGAQAVGGRRRELLPAAVADQVALMLGERDQAAQGAAGRSLSRRSRPRPRAAR